MSWKVRAMPLRSLRCGGWRVTSSPRKMMRPVVGLNAPAIRLKSVVLPAPLGPMIPRISSSETLTLTSRSAWKPPNVFPTPTVASTAVLAGCSAGPEPGPGDSILPRLRDGGLPDRAKLRHRWKHRVTPTLGPDCYRVKDRWHIVTCPLVRNGERSRYGRSPGIRAAGVDSGARG